MRPLEFYQNKVGDSAIRRLALKVERIDRLVRVAHADKDGRPPLKIADFPEGPWLIERAEALQVKENVPQPIMRGIHLVELGMKPGKVFGTLLQACYEAQLDGKFNDEASGLKFLKQMLAKGQL